MSITLVLGGARSGKSRFAESLAVAPKYYLATAQAFDDEMRARIVQHQSERDQTWNTIDTPLDLANTLRGVSQSGNFVLVDCLTLWLTNLMLAEVPWETDLETLLVALGETEAEIVLVSNEVGLGIVPDNALARAFRDAQGLTNQSVAEIADNVVFMAAGLPLILKGSLPRPGMQRPTKG